MTYRVVKAPRAQDEMAQFAAYAAAHSDEFASEQFTRLNHILSVEILSVELVSMAETRVVDSGNAPCHTTHHYFFQAVDADA